MSDTKKTEKIGMATKDSIIFGDYLDLFLNRDNDNNDYTRINIDKYAETEEGNEESDYSKSKLRKLKIYERLAYKKHQIIECAIDDKDLYCKFVGGVILPKTSVCNDITDYQKCEENDEGTGNIIIVGAAGTGKSTLAFQMAAACASDLNKGIAVFYSLEVPSQQIIKSMVNIDKQDDNSAKKRLTVRKLNYYDKSGNVENSSQLFEELVKTLGGQISNGDKEISNIDYQVILPSLSPCSLSSDDEKQNQVFLQRFKEIEMLLKAVNEYNKNAKDVPTVKMVVIDSLNAFSNAPINREAMIRLFGLFKHYGVLGVFTLGDDDVDACDNHVQAEVAKYLADVVIQLRKSICNNYTYNSFEVVKSRYIKSILGQQPYKIVTLPNTEESKNGTFPNLGVVKKVEVLPSLHYRIYGTERKFEHCYPPSKDKWTMNKAKNLFGISVMSKILPNHFLNWSIYQAQIITVSGASGLYKSDLAMNAILSGVSRGDNGLILRLSDREQFRVCGARLNSEVLASLDYKITEEGKAIKLIDISDEKESKPGKYSIGKWEYGRKGKNTKAKIIEMSYKSGALLPEELIEDVCQVINKENIKRLAFIDLKSIGTSYPFLVESPTSGALFLSAFVHIMRNYGVHVIMTSSNSPLQASAEQLLNARILSDASIEIVAQEEKKSYVIEENIRYERSDGKTKFLIKEVDDERNLIKSVKIVGEGLVVNSESASITVDNDSIAYFEFFETKGKKHIGKSARLKTYTINCNGVYGSVK